MVNGLLRKRSRSNLFKEMKGIQLFIEIIVILIVVFLQFYFFLRTCKRIKIHSGFFPHNSSSDYSLDNSKQIEIFPEYSSDLKEVISSINSYLKENSATGDFAIIKSIVERRIDSTENHVSVNISLPLYIGLMGTFSGIIIGLFQIAFSGGVTEQNINSFIGGVVIAMAASFLGLLLTVLNTSKNFRESKAICDERKNVFYDFLQVKLLPYVGNSLQDTLNRLKNNLNDFNEKFEKSIVLFDSKFSENILSLSTSVRGLSENINLVIENTNTQKEFLLELRRIGYNRMAEANIKVFQLLKETGPTFIKFIESQKELNESVEKANQFVGIIDSIFNRIKTFEESINNLGEHINANKFLGNDVLNRIDKNLSYLDQEFELLKQHEHKSTDSIKDYFEKQYLEIQKLTDTIKKEVEEAMNFKIGQNPFQKLLVLDAIDLRLAELNKKINQDPFQKLFVLDKMDLTLSELNTKISLNGDLKEMSQSLCETVLEIKGIKQQLSTAIEESKNSKKQSTRSKLNQVTGLNGVKKERFWRRLIQRINGN